MSGRLVAATMMTFVSVSKPIHLDEDLIESLFALVVRAAQPAPRWRPTASISSTKTIQGELRAWPYRNRSRTREAPTPTNISTNSEPLIEKKGTFASPATARAIRVLPVPGGPTRRTPLGMRAPSA